jgi:hypothetical protein
MRALKNSIQEVEIVNLGYAENGKGPYFVRQDGYPPGTTDYKDERFILLSDGTWMLNLKFMALPESEQEKHLLSSIREIYDRLQNVAGTPVVADATLPEGKTQEQLMREIEATAGRIRSRMKGAKGSRLDDLQA